MEVHIYLTTNAQGMERKFHYIRRSTNMDINKIGIAIIFGIVAVLAVLNVTGLDNMIKAEINQENQTALCQQAKALTSMADCTVLD